MVAATALLDAGGEAAVTLRAVAAATGLSHNAPYKHFASRDALLAAVAVADFRELADTFRGAKHSPQAPKDQLRAALEAVIRFSENHPGRYRLLLSNPIVAAQEGELKDAATGAFRRFAELIEACQADGTLPAVSSNALAEIVFAALHGLIDAEASGRLHSGKGLENVRDSMGLFLQLLSPQPAVPE